MDSISLFAFNGCKSLNFITMTMNTKNKISDLLKYCADCTFFSPCIYTVLGSLTILRTVCNN